MSSVVLHEQVCSMYLASMVVGHEALPQALSERRRWSPTAVREHHSELCLPWQPLAADALARLWRCVPRVEDRDVGPERMGDECRLELAWLGLEDARLVHHEPLCNEKVTYVATL